MAEEWQQRLYHQADKVLDRLDLRVASYRAENKGVRNEIVAILNAMKRQGWVGDKEYKKAHHQLL